MPKYDVTTTCRVTATYGIEADTQGEAEELVTHLFNVYVKRYNADKYPEVLSFCEEHEYGIEESTEWTASEQLPNPFRTRNIA